MGNAQDGLSRRRFLAGATGAAAALPLLSTGAGLAGCSAADSSSPATGMGGLPTSLEQLAELARQEGRGQPLVMCDLAAVDQNTAVLLNWSRENGFALRPALKSFQSPELCAYILQALPEPRGMVFHLGTVDEMLQAAPPDTDLLMGYPPTVGELEQYLIKGRPRLGPRQRLRILIDSVALAERTAELARATELPLPLDVALEFDSGMGRGGVDSAAELTALIRVLEQNRGLLQLGAVLCYDGHATLNGNALYRQLVAQTAQDRYAGFLAQLAAEGGHLYDEDTLIRNGPGSSNYRNWAGSDVANEISPGSAFMFAGYLGAFDNEGLAPAITQASPLMRITGDHPSVPLTQDTLPGAQEEEVIIKAGPWPGSDFAHPPGMRQDELSGGGFALVAPKGALALGDYVLMRPQQSGDGIDPFGALLAIREGHVVARWRTFARWSA